MAQELEIEKSKKQIELEKLKNENNNLDKLAEQLGEIERKIQQERIEQAIMSEDVEKTLNKITEEKIKKEDEEAKKVILMREQRKKELEEEERKLQEDLSSKIQGSVSENEKIYGYIKRYVLIGLVTGIPGIAITYLFDKWQDSKMVKDLYEAHIDMIQNPNNVELERIYQKKKLEFSRVYKIDKIEKLIKESDVISKLKTDRKALEQLSNEVEKAREVINKKLDEAMEKEAKLQEENEIEQMICEEEMEEELERMPPQL